MSEMSGLRLGSSVEACSGSESELESESESELESLEDDPEAEL